MSPSNKSWRLSRQFWQCLLLYVVDNLLIVHHVGLLLFNSHFRRFKRSLHISLFHHLYILLNIFCFCVINFCISFILLIIRLKSINTQDFASMFIIFKTRKEFIFKKIQIKEVGGAALVFNEVAYFDRNYVTALHESMIQRGNDRIVLKHCTTYVRLYHKALYTFYKLISCKWFEQIINMKYPNCDYHLKKNWILFLFHFEIFCKKLNQFISIFF